MAYRRTDSRRDGKTDRNKEGMHTANIHTLTHADQTVRIGYTYITHIYRQTETQTNRPAGIQTDRQTDRRTDRQTDRQTDR